MTTAKVASYLPLGLGPLVIRVNGTKVTKRLNLNFQMTGATTVDSAESDQLTIALPAGGGSSWDADVETWLTTPSSANLLAALDDKTGTGLAVFGTAPTIKTSLSIRNPGDTASYVVTPGAISANRVVNLPVLGADDTLVCLTATQTPTNKTINVSDNPLTSSSQAVGDILVNNGTRFVRLAKGSNGHFLRVNAGGTDLEYASISPTGTGLAKVSGSAFVSAAALLVNADVDAAAAIAGTKISPIFTALLAGARGLGFEVLTEAGAGPFNDYAIGNYSVLYVTSNATFTGFVPPAGGRAHLLLLCCPVANNITLNNLTGSTSAYQIALEGNAPAVAASGFVLLYVPGATKWKLLAYPQF